MPLKDLVSISSGSFQKLYYMTSSSNDDSIGNSFGNTASVHWKLARASKTGYLVVSRVACYIGLIGIVEPVKIETDGTNLCIGLLRINKVAHMKSNSSHFDAKNAESLYYYWIFVYRTSAFELVLSLSPEEDA